MGRVYRGKRRELAGKYDVFVSGMQKKCSQRYTRFLERVVGWIGGNVVGKNNEFSI